MIFGTAYSGPNCNGTAQEMKNTISCKYNGY